MIETDKASKIKGLAWLIFAVMLGVALAVGIGPLVRAIPWSWEKNTAQFFGSTVPVNVCEGSPQKQALLNQLVSRLYPIDRDDTHFSIDVHIINDPSINAFAQLGGQISLNRGLLEKAESPEEVAGVLAHEMEHVRRRHILEGFIVHLMTIQGIQLIFGGSLDTAQWAQVFLHMNFTRHQEAEADHGALVRLAKAHISNQGFGEFFDRMKELEIAPSFLSDHPSSEDRLEMVKGFPNLNTTPVMSKDDWKIFKAYCQ
jgi:predicted Zn-dependent protease